jgi:hypothetical protein
MKRAKVASDMHAKAVTPYLKGCYLGKSLISETYHGTGKGGEFTRPVRVLALHYMQFLMFFWAVSYPISLPFKQ